MPSPARSVARPQARLLPRRLRLWVGALVVALLFVGTLAQLHRAVHAPGLGAAQGASAAHPAPAVQAAHAVSARHMHGAGTAAGAQAVSRSGDGWSELFGTHSEAECRLYDQLSGDLALPVLPVVVLPLDLPTAQLLGRAGDFVARWAAFFDARGPPRATVDFLS